MFRRLQALLWLRTQIFLTNKNILVPTVMPYALVLLFKFTMNTEGMRGMALMSLCYSMAIGMAVGNPISAMIAEEKEKKTLNTMFLSGVRPVEYILSVLFYPIVISLVNLVLFPLITQTDVSEFWMNYSLRLLVTALVSMLINFYIGIRSVSQSQLQVIAMLFTMFISLAPSLALSNNGIAKIVRYSFLGAYMEFFEIPTGSLVTESLGFSFGWLLFIAVVLVVSLKRSNNSSFRL